MLTVAPMGNMKLETFFDTLEFPMVALMVKGGDSGAVIKRGDSSGSVLLQRVSATDLDERMPPEKEGEP